MGAGAGAPGTWGGGYITMGGLLPDSFKQKAIACWGERSSRQRGGRGADLLGTQAHLRAQGEESPEPSPEPLAVQLPDCTLAGFGDPSSSQPEGTPQSSLHAGNPPPTKDPGPAQGKEAGKQKERNPQPRPKAGERGPGVREGRDPSQPKASPTFSGHFPLVLQGWARPTPKGETDPQEAEVSGRICHLLGVGLPLGPTGSGPCA